MNTLEKLEKKVKKKRIIVKVESTKKDNLRSLFSNFSVKGGEFERMNQEVRISLSDFY